MPFHKSLEMSKDGSASKSRLGWLINSSKGEMVRCFLAEFVGTALLVIFTCGTCVGSGSRADTLVATSLSFGLTVSCLVAVFGHISGCHINPTITMGLLANGQITIIRSVIYLVAQVTGAISGAGILYGTLSKPETLCATTPQVVETLPAIILEAIICFLLVLTVCNAIQSNPNNAPLLIGFAVASGHLFGIPLTSAAMNPARAFGPALVMKVWDHHWVYWIGCLSGGAIGGFAHRFIFVNKKYEKIETTPKGNEEVPNVTTSI